MPKCCFIDWFTVETVVLRRSFYWKPQLPKRATFSLSEGSSTLKIACLSLKRPSSKSRHVDRYVLAWIDSLWIPGRAVITPESIWNRMAQSLIFLFLFFFRPSLIGGWIPVPLSMFEGQQQYRKYRKNDILFSPSYNTVKGQAILKLKRNQLFSIEVFFFSRTHDANVRSKNDLFKLIKLVPVFLSSLALSAALSAARDSKLLPFLVRQFCRVNFSVFTRL